MRIVAMTPAYARDVVTWRYPAPYGCYDMTGCDPGFLADPGNGFYAVVDDTGLIGLRSFGPDGQVPGGEYDSSALDTGGGLRPELVGQGIGRSAITTGLAFGREQFRPGAFRVTVAGFSRRALRVVTSLGFRPVSHFAALTNGRRYEVLVRPESAWPADGPGVSR
jgi:RimJ/RimL family protein N-acetyltransferase